MGISIEFLVEIGTEILIIADSRRSNNCLWPWPACQMTLKQGIVTIPLSTSHDLEIKDWSCCHNCLLRNCSQNHKIYSFVVSAYQLLHILGTQNVLRKSNFSTIRNDTICIII